ncbi:MAG: hypothetical protein QF904_01305 [Gemmatimonadota bacterium]|nr:hypothetical protein [Gemmatimonadota bacterium]
MTPPEPRSRRHPFPLDLPLVAVGLLAVILQASLFTREAAFRASWEERAEAELTVSADRIVGLLREAGEAALLRIRDVGEDPDTHALLSAREELERTARRPVFLDLERQLPVRRGREGVTVYDATGHPRAWSGWAPTATTTLSPPPLFPRRGAHSPGTHLHAAGGDPPHSGRGRPAWLCRLSEAAPRAVPAEQSLPADRRRAS